MAARTQRLARRRLPGARAHCQAVDARSIAVRDASFDAVVSCYLLELLGSEGILQTLGEIHRVLRPEGGSRWYDWPERARIQRSLPPRRESRAGLLGTAGRDAIPRVIRDYDFAVEHDRKVRQGFYPSRVLIARK